MEWLLGMMRWAGTNNSNNKNWQLWQQHNHPIELSANEVIEQRLNYLHQNPVAASFVDQPEHWKYSSAAAYCGKQGLLDIRRIE